MVSHVSSMDLDNSKITNNENDNSIWISRIEICPAPQQYTHGSIEIPNLNVLEFADHPINRKLDKPFNALSDTALYYESTPDFSKKDTFEGLNGMISVKLFKESDMTYPSYQCTNDILSCYISNFNTKPGTYMLSIEFVELQKKERNAMDSNIDLRISLIPTTRN